MARLKRNSHLIIYRKYSTSLKFVMLALCVLIVTMVLPKQARFRFEYEKGRKWMQKDLVSPYNFAIKKTNAEIEKDRKEILKSVFPVYQNNDDIALKAIEDNITEFETRWKDTGGSASEKKRFESLATTILNNVYKRGIINPVKKYQSTDANYNFNLVKNNVSGQMNTMDVFTIKTAENYIDEQLSKVSDLEMRTWLAKLLKGHLQVNYIFDERITNKLEEDALSSISTT
ncbi:MAG: transmembrane HD family protein, partial [Daejeonella sp.]